MLKAVLVLGTILISSISLRAGFIYTFSFHPLPSFPAAFIEYSAPTFPTVEDVLSLSYMSGNVNGCAPSTIEAAFQDSTTLIFGSDLGAAPPACPSNPVLGFAFVIDVTSGDGVYDTLLAGREVHGPNGPVIHYAAGVMTVTETPTPAPLPEPTNAAAVSTAILFYAAYRLRHLNRRA